MDVVTVTVQPQPIPYRQWGHSTHFALFLPHGYTRSLSSHEHHITVALCLPVNSKALWGKAGSCIINDIQWRTEGLGGGVRGIKTPLLKFLRPSKIVPNSTRLWKLLKIAEFRTRTPQVVRKKSSKILKLPPVRNCFTLAMTNKLVVIINSLKVPKIKKILLYEMKFLVTNYSCLQNPWLGGLPTPDPRPLCPLSSIEFVEPPHKTNFLRTPLMILQVYPLVSCVGVKLLENIDVSWSFVNETQFWGC